MRNRSKSARSILAAVLTAVFAVALLPPVASAHDRYDNTWMKDFMMDAPWRVKDADTSIPLMLVLKDCDADDIRELHWIRCWDVTSGETILWNHDFGDELIGDDPYESNYWTWITTVTEGHPSLPDGTPLTPANLGYSAGDAINLKVSIYYKDDWFNYTETRYLRIHVARGDYPWPDGWYGGDTHYHTMYTNNLAEFGAPLPAVVRAGEAMGLHWLTTTDHSCDLDETGDGSYSYATTHWEYTIQDETGISTVYRDNTAIGTTWDVLGDDVAMLDSPSFRLYRAVELNAASIDGDSFNKTLHTLVYNENYISSPLSGALGERPVTPDLPGVLSQISGGGFMYAAHPLSDMSAEWGGLDWGIDGTMWGDEDIATALGYEVFKGLQAFNTRHSLYSSDQNNPWADFDAGVTPSDPYPNELLAGIATWNGLLETGLDPLVKCFLSGGSDAHGDLNYGTFIGLDNYATDNAIGKVQTVVRVPGSYGPGNLPPISELLAALRAGRSVVTDGPFVLLGIDENGDGDFDDASDLAIGEDGSWDPFLELPITLRWSSTEDFGPIVHIELLASSETGTQALFSFNPDAIGEGYAGERVLEYPAGSFDEPHAFRVECSSTRDGQTYRAYSNPVWISSDGTSVPDDVLESCLWLVARGNPFTSGTSIDFSVPSGSDATVSVFDISGRIVTTLHVGHTDERVNTVAWNGADGSGKRVASGVYLVTLSSGNETATAKVVLLR